MRVNLLVDGNYLTHKGIFALKGQKSMYVDLPILLRKDFEKIQGEYPFDHIYLLSDTPRYWRKEVYPGYKSKRKTDEEIDWDHVYKVYADFREEIGSRPRTTHVAVPGAEADDLVADLTRRSNSVGTNCVIVAADSDLHQILDFDTEGGWVNFVHNYKFSDPRSYWPSGYRAFVSWLEGAGGDVFDMGGEDDFLGYVRRVLSTTKVSEVDPEQSLFCKVVAGDPKDTVKSCHVVPTRDGKERGIGESGAERIYRLYKELHPGPVIFDSADFPHSLTEAVFLHRKLDPSDRELREEVRIAIEGNLRIKELSRRHLPGKIIEKMTGLT